MKQVNTHTRTFALLFLLAFGVLAAVVAVRQRVGGAPQPAPGAEGRMGVQVNAAPPPAAQVRPAWSDQVSLGRAVLEEGHLVQHLPDGRKLRLTLSPDLQQKAEQLLAHYQVPYGAIVVISVRTGAIRVLAGHSRADPALTPRTLATTAWAPAASVFKLVTAAALLEQNKARPLTRICYHGGLRDLTARNLRDDPARDTTCHTLADAIGMSINPVMGKLALKLSREQLLGAANRFGWNATIDFDLRMRPSRAEIPREDLARAKVAAGFWHTTLSPLHGALIAQALANGGTMVRPRLVAEVRGPGDRREDLPERWTRQVVTPFVAKVVGRMMVLTTTVGTARDGFYDRKGRAYLPAFRVAAKTGTLTRKEPVVDYNWLIGFAPYERPEVAFAILLGNELKWRTKPHFLARQLLKAIFADKARRTPSPAPRPRR